MSPENPFIWGQKVTSHKNIASMCLCTLVSAGFFLLQFVLEVITVVMFVIRNNVEDAAK